MKGISLVILLIDVCYCTFAQGILKLKRASHHSIYVCGTDFEGVIFKENYRDRFDHKQTRAFTPTKEDVLSAEKQLRIFLKSRPDSVDNADFVYSNLNTYIRQYLGIVNKNGNKSINIIAFCHSTLIRRKRWLKETEFVWDGGPRFWTARFNTVTKGFDNFYVNGR